MKLDSHLHVKIILAHVTSHIQSNKKLYVEESSLGFRTNLIAEGCECYFSLLGGQSSCVFCCKKGLMSVVSYEVNEKTSEWKNFQIKIVCNID